MTKAAATSLSKKKPSKKVEERAERVRTLLPILKQTYPQAKCSLDYTNPFELLIATILSAQCTDERVNIVTKDLFRKYRNPRQLANVAQAELAKDIHSSGFFRKRARSWRGMAAVIVGRP